MKRVQQGILVFGILILSTLTAKAQQPSYDCSKVEVLEEFRSKTYVRITTCHNDTILQEVETFLEPTFRKIAFKRKWYKTSRHGVSKEYFKNGDYREEIFENGVLVSAKGYDKNGVEIPFAEFEKRYPELTFMNSVKEYYSKRSQLFWIIGI